MSLENWKKVQLFGNSEQFKNEGKGLVTRQRPHYNPDGIIAVGFRINTKRGSSFRQWLLKGPRISRFKTIIVKQQGQKTLEVQTLKNGIRTLSRAIEGKIGDSHLEWLNQFAKGLGLRFVRADP